MSSNFGMLPPTMGLAELVNRAGQRTPPIYGGQPPLGGAPAQPTSFNGQTPSPVGQNGMGPAPATPSVIAPPAPPAITPPRPAPITQAPTAPVPQPPVASAPMPPTSATAPMPPSAAPPQPFYGGQPPMAPPNSMRLGDLMQRRQATKRPGMY